MTITSSTMIYKGFTITPTFKSSATRRTCSTVQAYIVSHINSKDDGAPCGWRKTVRDAKSDIDEFLRDSTRSAEELADAQWTDGYLTRIAVIVPSSAAADALEIRRRRAAEKAAKVEAWKAEQAKLDRIRAAAPDMLEVLRMIDRYTRGAAGECRMDPIDGVRIRLTPANIEAVRAVIAKAEGA